MKGCGTVPNLVRPAKRPLTEAEVNYLNYGLGLELPAAQQKRALQRLCELYEQGGRIQNPAHTRQLIHSLMASKEVLVRRWAIKALSLIGHPDDFQRIADRLKVEDDFEAQTWGVTGLVRNARDRGLEELCGLAGISRTGAVTLAARLYAPDSWVANHTDWPRITLHDDELTLKWATFLIGYNRAPEDLFDPRHSNEVFLGELNAHDATDISEYSIWALWERPEFGARYLRIPLDQADRHEESVRKWLYRLATKSHASAGLDPDGLGRLRRDDGPRAREGLALGAGDLPPDRFGDEILEWYTIEDHPQVSENLLTSMTARSAEHAAYADAVERRFRREAPDSALRRRLLAASANMPLYRTLRGIAAKDQIQLQGLFEYGAGATIVLGDQNVTNNNARLNVGGNLNAQNVAVGDMIASANSAIQRLERSDQGTAQALQQVLAMLANSNFEAGRADVVKAVNDVAAAPTEANKQSLLERLKGYAKAAVTAGALLEGADKVISGVEALMS